MRVEVRPDLFIGDAHSAQDVADIDFVVNVTTDLPFHEKDKDSYRIPVLDIGVESQLQLMAQHLPIACGKIRSHLKKGNKVLVHCSMGRQRSCAIVLAYLMLTEGLTLNAAISSIKAVHLDAFDDGAVHFKDAVVYWIMQLDGNTPFKQINF